MTIRLTLLRSAAPVEHEAAFASDTPLDERALHQARSIAPSLPPATTCRTAPSRRCAQTAHALGVADARTEPALRDADMGRWRGRTPGEVAADDAEALARWMSDPHAAPHGGESVAAVCARVASWLDDMPADAGRVLAVVEQSVARAALIHALNAPLAAFWRIDVPPLSAVHLTGRDGRWNLRMGAV
ncbi:histidine phosphatase family protein [Streptomyces sp. Ru71]|nr:histidine phosphatase family protein [Streptomyces sp. Ru71]